MFQPKLVAIITLTWWSSSVVKYAVAGPQTNLVNQGCSTYNASNLRSFYANINGTFSDLRGEISNQSTHFATAQQARGDVLTYALLQCRNYLSKNDCLACFHTASIQIRNCSAGNGARVIYDGCLLRYESERFYDQTNEPGSGVSCGNKTSNVTITSVGLQVLTDLQTATPKIKGFYAATKTDVVVNGTAIYAIAQCVETATEDKCLSCMQVAYNNLQSCFPNTDGRAFDAGCFMRYSTTPFFADNQTIDITPYLNKGGSSKKWGIIGGVVGGVVLILLVLFAWLWFRKPKRVPRGNILGATELKGPVNYKYKDLKAATKNFKDENKLGEGGFGDVYKGTLKNGKVVAIKKLVLGKSSKMDDDFEGEVKLISNVHHRNLVRLLGCCSKGQERILVYEGYTAPEYAMHGQLSEKADTYSYGIVVLEIISGQKSTDVKGDEESHEYLLQRTWNLYEKGLHLELLEKDIDPNDYDAGDMKKIIEIALLCTQASPATRPTMSEVVVLLKSKSLLEHLRPTMPVFVETNIKTKEGNSSSTTGSSSNATASISILSAR
ncbi:hypothetical protein Fmac_014374 [Flemingia macrophylla]|uniref:Cysteine-rich receptor-like protein kinase 2 n=1 Tax=Flemingia macrophylla TaxID=520843 RepID=A0ABD1MBJ4_9FABA